ncbi:MAG: MATE family efflux transporter [Cellulosilyticum sp.]|nr:MATE family efflux transporter [Cellulosilyticum sp.]
MEKNEAVFEGHSVPRMIMKFAIPTILSQLVTLLYNLADTFFVGHTNNPAEVAALTLSFPIFMLLTMVGNLFGIGANSSISRFLGTGKREEAKQTSTFAFYGALGATLLLVIVIKLGMTPILQGIGARSEAVFNATSAYISWTVVIGGLPTVAALMLGHLIRAEGNTKQASIGMALGGILNILLDPIFVQGMQMGAKGAAIATCIANTISFLYFLMMVRKNKQTVIELHFKKLTFVPDIMKQVILVGIPAAMIIVLGSSANIVLTRLMSEYGEVSVAAFGIVQKIGTITIQITIGLTQGIMPLLGYSYGANQLERVKEINRWAFGILAVYALICVGLIEVFAKQLLYLFTSEANTIEIGISFLRTWIFCAPGMCFTNLFNAIFQAMGKWFQSLMLSVIRQGVLLIPLLMLLNRLLGAKGLVWSQPIADTFSLIIGIVFYLYILKGEAKYKAQKRKQEAA